MRRFYTYSSKFIAINVFGFIPAVISYNTESHELAIFWILLIMLIVTVIHLFVYAVACMVTENSMERIDSVYRDKKNITTPLQALKSHIGSTYQISRKGGRSKHKIVTASKNQEPGISSPKKRRNWMQSTTISRKYIADKYFVLYVSCTGCLRIK